MLPKRIQLLLIAIACLVSIPAIAMLFTDEVNWSIFDFVVMSILLVSIGLIGDYILKKITHNTTKIVLLVILFIALIVIWLELAVGILNSPFAGS